MGDIPAFNAPWSKITEYALSFNAYERWSQDPEMLNQMLQPLIEEHRAQGRIPERAGDDALRAWLFLLVRHEHFTESLQPVSDDSFAVMEPNKNPIIRHLVIELGRRRSMGRNSAN